MKPHLSLKISKKQPKKKNKKNLIWDRKARERKEEKAARLGKEENQKTKNDTKLLPMTVIIINVITLFILDERLEFQSNRYRRSQYL